MEFGRSGSTNPGVEIKPGRAMRALGELLRMQDLDPFTLFDVALEMLVRQFLVDHALITRLSQGKLDTFWWVDAGRGAREPIELHQSLNLCERVLKDPSGSLALGTVYSSEGGPWLRAFAGVVLQEGKQRVGTLAVINSQPYAFHEEDLGFMRSVAGLLGRALEIENLKYELQVARESLALSAAVVQDSALESPITGLPNGRYLDVWTKNHMPHARRQKEILCMALWEDVSKEPRIRMLLNVAKGLRSDDLLVELGSHRYLLLLPQTPQEGANQLLERIHNELGQPSMGATIWLSDRDDLQLRGAMGRSEQARQEALREGGIRWKLATQLGLD